MPNNLKFNAVKIIEKNGKRLLELKKRALPLLNPNEITIRVACAGINAPDILQVRGLYVPTKENASWLGLEVSGEVFAVGRNVTNFKVGDRVVALCNGGGYGEFVNVVASQALPLPKNWSFVEGATIPETFFTITQTLLMKAKLKKNKFVLIHGSSGGLGASAIQLVKYYGAQPIALVSSNEKKQYVKNLGAEFIINYKQSDFTQEVLEITKGKGADVIIDIIGGDVFVKNISACAQNGTIILLGLLGGIKAEINLAPILLKNINIFGSTLGPKSTKEKATIALYLKKNIWQALETKKIVPPFISSFNLNEASLAHEQMQTKEHFGKIVLISDFGKNRL